MNIRFVSKLAVVCLLAVGGGAAAQSKGKLQLEPCRLPGWDEDVRCGRYEVYEDRQARTGRKLALKLVVLPALSDKPQPDPVFYFAGGPGGSATDTIARAGQSYLAHLRRERDLVFVDQRGTGGSHPLACNLYPDKNDMAAYFSEVLPLERLRACRAELEKVANLKLYSTPVAMADVDDVRAALGCERINLYGGSYGSTAALSYLRLYPQRVRTATLLGVAPPDMKLPLPAIKGVQHAVERTFADCAAEPNCHAAFPNLSNDLATALQRLDREPARFEAINPFTRQSQPVTLTRAVFGELVRTLLYQPEFSRWLPLLVHQAAAGEYRLFASIAWQSFRAIEDQVARGLHFSVVCGEHVPFITDDEIARAKAGSFYGDARLQAYRKVCRFWPRASVAANAVTPVKSDKPVLLISGEADPVAPPWLAAGAAKHLPNSRHLTIPHGGHAFSYSCVNRLIGAFVATGSAKGLDAGCVAELRRLAFVTPATLAALAQNNDNAAAAKEEVWQGVLVAGSQKLRVVLRLSQAADGKPTGKLDSPDQPGVTGLPVNVLTWQEGVLRFEVNLIGASYEGKTAGGSGEIEGQWRQRGMSFPLTFKRIAEPG